MSKKIVVIGETGYGKTTLLAAIKNIFKGEFTDPKDIENIDSRYDVKLSYGGEEYEFFDFSKAEDYAENIDGTEICAVLVIDSCEGPCSSTREQIEICIEKGIVNFVIFMNKWDLIDDDYLMKVCEGETREVFDEEGIFSDDVPAVWGSAKKALSDPNSNWGYFITKLVEKVLSEF